MMKAGGLPGTKHPLLHEQLPNKAPAEACVHQAKASRCPKLTRYKMVLVIVMMAFVLFGITSLRSQHPYLNTCQQLSDAFSQESRTGTVGLANLRYSHTKRHLPQCVIIGARKAGTRALLYFLNLHTQVQIAGREVHFFDKNYEQGLEWYRKQMPYAFKDQITIEKSPAYFVEPDVPARMYKMNSSVKLLLIVRDPIDRTMSDYLQIMDNKVKRQKPLIPFEKLVLDQENYEINKSYTAIKRSIYIRHLQRWLRYFPRSQIHIVDGDTMINKPWEELGKVEDFLGLEHQITHDRFTFNETRGFYCFRTLDIEQCLADGKGRPHPEIDPYTLKKLVEFFTPYNEKFFERIGTSIKWHHWT